MAKKNNKPVHKEFNPEWVNDIIRRDKGVAIPGRSNPSNGNRPIKKGR